MSPNLVAAAVARSWWIALVCAVVGASAGAAAALSTPAEWTARAELAVSGPDVQDTVTGALVTQMAAKSAADLVDDRAFLDTWLPSRHGGTDVTASVPFGASDVVVVATATSRAGASAAVLAVAEGMTSQVTIVDAHIADSAARQRVATDLAVRLRRTGGVVAPIAPASPVLVLDVLAGLIAGAGLGCGLALMRDALLLVANRPGGSHRGPRERSDRRSITVPELFPSRSAATGLLLTAREGHRA